MTKVLITQSKLDTLAEVIGGKSNTNVPLTVDEMITAADSITSGGGSPTLETVTKTYTPSTSAVTDTITPSAGYDGIEEVDVTVSAVPLAGIWDSDVLGSFETISGIRKWKERGMIDYGDGGFVSGVQYTNYTTKNAVPSGTTVTPSTSSQTIGGANYMMEGAVTVSAMPSGTAGTPTATKGAVNNHAIAVTPSVTNTTGYITGSTKTGTAVSVSASELVSGTLSVSSNGQQDVTNYQYIDVSVSGGGGMSISTSSTTLNAANASISFTGLQDEPTSFVITTASDLATGASPYKTATVVYDGTNVFGQYITNTNNANVTYATTFSQSYNNGTLTVTGTGSNFQANEYKLVYTYGGSSYNIATSDVQVGSGATSITFTGLTDEPSYFSLAFKSDFGTSSGYQRVITVVYDGNTTYGLAMDSSAKAQTSWSYTYNNGTLTISSSGTNAGGYFHQPGYYQLTYGIGGTVELDIQPLSVTTNGTYQQSGVAYSPVVVNVSGGGSSSVETKSYTNSDNTATSIQFTSLKGTPIAWFVRCATQMQSSSSTYYYVSNMRYNGTNVNGNAFRMGSTRQVTVVTSGYSYSYNNGTLTVSSSGSRTSAPGSFYNGTYELTYVY